MTHFFKDLFFAIFILIGQYSSDRKQSRWERAGGIGKGPQAGTWTQDAGAQQRYMTVHCPQGYWRRRLDNFFKYECICP